MPFTVAYMLIEVDKKIYKIKFYIDTSQQKDIGMILLKRHSTVENWMVL